MVRKQLDIINEIGYLQAPDRLAKVVSCECRSWENTVFKKV